MKKKSLLILFCKSLLTCFLLVGLSLRLSAQTITNYTFAASSGTFTALSGATSPTLTAGTTDDGNFNALPIGFDFWYMGTRYTTVSASTNGWAAFGPTITDTYTNALATGGTRPLIAPLWDDLDIQAAGNFIYLTSGTAGSRVFTMQWLNTKWQYTALGSVISFQVKLYESSGKIEFIYRSEAGIAVFPSASVGIASSATGSGSFLSVNNTGTGTSSTVEASVISKPVSGKTYGFTPSIPTAPSGLSFSSVGAASMTLNWTDNASNETGYVIYSSTDGVNYSFTTQTAAGITSSVQSGLTTGMTYYWKVYAVTEGGLSTALSGNQATTGVVPAITYTTPQVYTVGTTITTLTPANTGGAVSAIGFGAATALTGATLNNPRGVAIDASGNIYVTNSGNNTISKYNASGTYLGTFGSGATLSFPKDLVFDSSGNAYVLNLGASAGTGSVYKYNSSGVYQSTILSGLNYALGITIDASDNIYIADQGATTVKKYSTSGALLLSLPTTNLSTPLGVATDGSGNIYVLNNGTGNVTKYNSAGTYLSTILSGYTSGQAIAIDGAGNIYVGDNSATNTVYIYNQSGTLLTSKAITDPEGIAVDSKGDIFASAYFANQMNQYKPTGGYFLSGALPAGLSFDSTTGQISGTPTATMAATVYTVTAYNSAGSGSTTVSITVNNPTYGNYAFQDLITLNTTSLGITSNLTNFPALLSIQDNDLIISNTCADKVQNPNGPNYDLAFVSGGSELYYQIESYNQTTGTLLVWVQVPSLTYATNNTISFYFGSKAPTVTHNTAFFQNTWASDYKAVFHFNESSYTGSVTDGTAGAHTGTTSGMTSADLVTGKIGTAYSFNGSSKKITSNAVSVTGPFTISAWVNLGATGLDQKVMTNQDATGSASGGYKLGVFTTNIPESESGTAINRASTPNPTAFTTGVWHYIQGVYTGTTLSTYVDGVQYKVLTTSVNPVANTNFYIGTEGGGGAPFFNGSIDEPRVSNVAKTADWLKAEYVNQNNPTAFTSVAATTTNTTNAAAITGSLTYTWTGATSTNPAVATNWNNTTAGTTNQLPAFDGSATLVIPSGLTNYPSLTANASLYGLTIASGASLNLNGFTLSVGCNIYNSSTGQILYGGNNASGITWNGASATQTYNGANTANTASVGQMTVNNSAAGTVTISGGPVDIYNSLTMTKGSLVISSSPAALTLKSTATVSASVAAIPAGSTITGTVNVERFITGGGGYRGYRLMSSPIYGSTVSSNNVYSINYIKNSSYTTGTTGVPGGFDKAGNPTFYLYRENMAPSNITFISGNFRGVNTLGTAPNYSYLIDGDAGTFNIPVGNGFLFFFRGDKSVGTLAAETTTTYVPTNTTLTTSGTLNIGQVIVKDWYTPASSYLGWTNATANSTVRGFNLVGNPYASSIDWETYNTTTSTSGIYVVNVGTTIYELNPFTKNFDIYQKGGVSTNHGSNVIASGQGFFVLAANNTNPQLIFNESAKTTAQNTGLNLFMATKADMASLNNTGQDQHLRLQLAKDSVNADDIYIGFNSSARAQYVDNEDAPYKVGTGPESLASISGDNIALGINRLPLPKQSETIGLKVEAAADGIYKLNMTELKAIPQLFEVWLMDAYKKDSLDMRHNTTYAFNLYKADTNSFGSRRFSLVIRQNPALALHLLDFKAAKTTDGSQLTWKTENEENYTHFTVERSVDGGKNFEVVGGFNSSGQGTYSLLDKNPLMGIDQYRLKEVDLNGNISYSNVIPLMYSNQSNAIANNYINIYPNPAISTINLSIVQNIAASRNTSAASYGITITNSSGSVIKTISSSQSLLQQNVSGLLPGTYVIQVVNNSDNSLVGKGKFVKL